MELWIRSQDKMKLVSNCNLYISTEMKNEYIIEDLNNKYLKLGTYATKERALEVLDEIQERMINNSLINRKIYADNFKKVYDLKSDELKPYITEIYEMPEK